MDFRLINTIYKIMKQNHRKAYTTPNVEIVLIQVESPIAASNDDGIGFDDYEYDDPAYLF